ncbi:MAG: ABC transporter ATP-binding protein [Bryobacterales bacterium]|nr:ABC transporter ATP-binding protein [Opitutaceae bacterium]MCZ2157127.1 ABC transporter ATP-binding protein [Bryobacterales bacterium]
MSDDTPILEVRNVSKRFARRLQTSLRYGVVDALRDMTGFRPRQGLGKEEFWALDDVSFTLRRGESVGLLGANGAGKSTLLKIIAGLIKPDRGQVIVRGRVGALIELGAGMHPLLSGRENIRVNAAVLGLTQRELAAKLDEIIAFADLGEFIDAPVQSYSSGMRVRLGFAVAAHLEPDLLLVDEVLAVGDVSFRMKCFQRIEKLMREGTSPILVSHNVIDITRICSAALVLKHGRGEIAPSVEAGIALYQEIGLATEPTQSSNRDVWLESAALHPVPGRPPGALFTGDTLSFDVRIACRHPRRNLRLIVHVHSSSLGVLGSFASPADGLVWSLQRRATVRITLPALPLLVGAYSITTSLYGEGRQEYLHDLPHAVRFQVTGPPIDGFGFGPCHTFAFSHKWETMECD